MTAQVTKITDSNKRLVVRLIGDAAEARTIKIDAGSLNFALNTNNKLLGTGTDRKTKYRLFLKKITYDINGGDVRGYVLLSTDGDVGNNIITLSGADNKCFVDGGGDSFHIPISNIGNTTGNVFLQTFGFQGNCSYTIIADFRKDGADYDQGQSAIPRDFNQ